MDEENQYDYIEWPEEEHFPPRHRNSSCSVKEKNREPVLLYQPERHMSKAFAVMEDMRRTNKLCDVVIKVGSLSLNAHRVILASSSPYFDAMFSGKNVESQGGVVNIKEFNPDAIQNLVDFFYTSSLTINSSNVQELLPAAGLLQLDGVVGACCDFLASQLHPSNCLGIRLFSSTHTCSSLWRQCNMFMQQRFPEIVLHEEFLDLGFDELYKVVSDSSLNVRGEEQVYEAVLSWVRHRLDERKCHVSDLLKCVRMPLMSATYLSREVRKEPLLMECFDGRGLLIDAMDFHLRKHYARDNTSQDKKISTTPRRCPGLEFLFAVGGAGPPVLENDPYLDLCECLDVEKNEWRTVAPMSMRRSGLRVASVGGYLFAVGGFSALDTKALDVVDRYDPMTDSWRLVAPMNSARRSFAVAVLNGYLYAMGGINGGTYYDSVERYCPRSNKWVFIQRMSVERRAVCAAGLDNHIYAAGICVWCVCMYVWREKYSSAHVQYPRIS